MTLRQMPGWRVTMDDPVDGATQVYTTATRKRRCTKVDTGCDCAKEHQHLDNRAYSAEVETEDPRVAAICAVMEDVLHEAMEWYTIDGEMFVDPHGWTAGSDLIPRMGAWLAKELHSAREDIDLLKAEREARIAGTL